MIDSIPNPFKRKPPFVTLSKSMYFSHESTIATVVMTTLPFCVINVNVITLRSQDVRRRRQVIKIDQFPACVVISPARMGRVPQAPVHHVSAVLVGLPPLPVHDVLRKVTRQCPTPRTAGSAPPSPDTGA